MEYIIVNSALSYPHALDEFLESVPLKHFELDSQKVLRSILKLLAQNKPVTIEGIKVELGEGFCSGEYFAQMLGAQILPNWQSLKEDFKKHLALKKQEKLAHKLLSASHNAEVLDIELLNAELEVNRGEFKTLGDWLDFYAKAPVLPKIPCGIDFLDTCFEGGFELGQLVLISGDPEAGKTMLGVQMLEHMAKTHRVGFFCFEFTIESYLKRHRVKRLENMYLFNDGYEISEVCQNIKSLYKKGVRVFLIDSQMRIQSSGGRNMEEEESLKFSSLARLCHSLKILVFMIVQTSKGDRDNPMGSKKGGHEASITIRIERVAPSKEYAQVSEYDENSRLVIVKKNKQTGKHFKDKVLFDPKTCQFSNPNFKAKSVEKSLSMEEIEAMMRSFS